MTIRDTLSRPPPRLLTPHEQRRRDQREALASMRRDPEPMPAPVVDVSRLRSQVAQLSDDDFRALVVSEAQRRDLKAWWRWEDQ